MNKQVAFPVVKFLPLAALAAVVVSQSAITAKAVLMVTAGNTVTGITPDANFEPAGSVLVAGPLTVSGATTDGGSYTYTEEVYKEPLTPNELGTPSGYDFLMQVKDTGSTAISSLDFSTLTNTTTAVGYETTVPPGFSPATTAVVAVSRSFDDTTLDYTFSGGISPGASSDVFVAQTNANFFNQLSGLILIDSGPGSAGVAVVSNVYGPVFTSVPEPASLGLLCVGGLALVRRRPRRAAGL